MASNPRARPQYQMESKIGSTNHQKLDPEMDRAMIDQGAEKEPLKRFGTTRSGPRGGGRRRGKPLLGGMLDNNSPLNHLSPRGLVGFFVFPY